MSQPTHPDASSPLTKQKSANEIHFSVAQVNLDTYGRVTLAMGNNEENAVCSGDRNSGISTAEGQKHDNLNAETDIRAARCKTGECLQVGKYWII
jgi:hypothetical protein